MRLSCCRPPYNRGEGLGMCNDRTSDKRFLNQDKFLGPVTVFNKLSKRCINPIHFDLCKLTNPITLDFTVDPRIVVCKLTNLNTEQLNSSDRKLLVTIHYYSCQNQ